MGLRNEKEERETSTILMKKDECAERDGMRVNEE